VTACRAPGVFLDRDGVINEEVDLLCRGDQLSLIDGSAEAIRRLNEADLRVIVVTNQPVVARGLCTEQDVERIHGKLERMLADRGARVDAFYFCPHHENANLPQYRTVCECRKPNIGMLTKAAERFGLDLGRSYMVGDRTVDIQAGANAGCVTILVKTGYGGTDGKCPVMPMFTCVNLAAAADIILAGDCSCAGDGVSSK
jgi:mannose-1-phosphate guanylyltransferase / phosphomannomutase